MRSTTLFSIFSIALTATAQTSHVPDTDLDCSSANYSPFTGPLGSFCPTQPERCCAFLCLGAGHTNGPICSQKDGLERATCTPCKYDTVTPEPTCDASNTPTPKEFGQSACAPASSPNPCCAYICQRREAPFEPKCYSKPQRENGLWCLRCHTSEELAGANPGGNGTSNGNGTAPTSTGFPQPTYSSGAGALTFGAGALVGLFSLMFAM
ncbi:hypothetical protein TWF730_003696 [Orbilia blumenaviensis]|uniref:Uncharacterized protein n=1 Tax=Orbilia blumenaviensis TaxID=1796055 RepID=A0AAV9U581_9PEZI